jgi:hypothetical protein
MNHAQYITVDITNRAYTTRGGRMNVRSEKSLHETWRRNAVKALLAGIVALAPAIGSSQPKTEQCNDREYRDSECLQNYYMCNLDSRECLKIFDNCRKSAEEPEKRCPKGA